MQRSRVSYRFLQAVTNPLTGDSTTVGLLHWDGTELRFAGNAQHLSKGKSDVRRVLRGIRKGAQALPVDQFDLFLHDVERVLPVAEGRGAMLRWAPSIAGQTRDPGTHFSQLAEEAGLVALGSSPSFVSTKMVRSGLVDVATRLAEKFPDLVGTDQETSGHYPFKVPIAWKNSVNHYGLPTVFEGKLEPQIRSLVGKITTGISNNDRALVVYPLPEDRAFRDDVARELHFLADMTRARCLPLTAGTDSTLNTTAFEDLVLQDVRAAAAH